MTATSETEPKPNRDRRWQVAGDTDLLWRKWDRSAVVFHPLSGETHYLNLVSMVALELLESASYSAPELAQAMARYLDVPMDDKMRGQASALIDQFDALGLVEPCRH